MMGATVSGASIFEEKLGRLPAVVRAKFLALEARADDLADAARAAVVAWEETHRRVVEARGAHAAAEAVERRDPEVTAKRRLGTYTPGARLQAAVATLAMAEERAAARLADRDQAQEKSTAALSVARALTQLITDTDDPSKLAPVLVPRPSGANPAADVQRLREQLANVLREEVTLRHAPVPLDEAIERQDAWLDAAAKDYTPPVLHFTTPAYVPPGFEVFAPVRIVAMWATMPEWRDLQRRLLREQYAHLPAAVATDERAGLAAALTERKVKLERQEESLILLAETQGIALARRADADARVVLTTLAEP